MSQLLFVFISLSLGFACVLVTIPASAQAADCEFVLGFRAIQQAIPEVVGSCLTDEYHNPANGDGLQETTAWHGKGGLLVWRKADNWTAFTDGTHTWVNGPYGLQKRLNGELFSWEARGGSAANAAGAAPLSASRPSLSFEPIPAVVPRRVANPTRVIIPGIGVNAAIERVTTEPGNVLGAPRDPRAVGWYTLGPRPGEPGNALLTGHVDNRYIGPAVFWSLRTLKPGDAVYVETVDGERLRFVVSESKLYDKNDRELRDVYGPTVRPAITLISCEGAFDGAIRDYSHRRVVRAHLEG